MGPGKTLKSSYSFLTVPHIITLHLLHTNTFDLTHSSTLAWIIPWTEEPG